MVEERRKTYLSLLLLRVHDGVEGRVIGDECDRVDPGNHVLVSTLEFVGCRRGVTIDWEVAKPIEALKHVMLSSRKATNLQSALQGGWRLILAHVGLVGGVHSQRNLDVSCIQTLDSRDCGSVSLVFVDARIHFVLSVSTSSVGTIALHV
jgi:hypothetical protein